MMLKRFWFKFELTLGDPHPPGTLMGCGVTANDLDDAMQLLREKVFKSESLPGIKSIDSEVDISKLDEGHILPNMGNPVVRGVWFPLGYG